jgi:hypothetical protein
MASGSCALGKQLISDDEWVGIFPRLRGHQMRLEALGHYNGTAVKREARKEGLT